MSVTIYWLVINLYAFMVRIASLFNPKAKLFVAGRRNILERIRFTLDPDPRSRIWMHCASLGEFEQGRPVLEKLKAEYPNYAFVLTFFSPSGYEAMKDYNGADYVFYLPLDSNRNASFFLKALEPALCIFVKYELWYYYLTQIARYRVPLLLVSAIFRPEQPFFKWYGGLHRKMLRTFTHIFVQDAASAQLLHKEGVDSTTISGDTRFDRVAETLLKPMEQPVVARFARGHKLIVAGSTWADDEALLKKTLQLLPANWKLLLVPHEVFKPHIEQLEKDFSSSCTLLSNWRDDDEQKRVLIIDRVGMLSQLYRYADVAWIGGGFGKEGVHNVLEAAVYSKPVYYGPIYHKFREAVELIAAGGAASVNTAADFAQHILTTHNNGTPEHTMGMAAGRYVQQNKGATTAIVSYIDAKKWLTTA